MYARPSHIKKTKRICCSIECSNHLRKEYMKGKQNHQYGLKGRDNPTYSGRETRIRDGYKSIRNYTHPFAQDNGWVLEHRLIAEKYLLDDINSVVINGQQYLSQEYVVHHKDLDKSNNMFDNLKVMTVSEHTKLHNLLDPAPRDEGTGQFIERGSGGFGSTGR